MRTREAVLRLLRDGESQAQVVRALGLSKSTIAYHARQLGPGDPRFRRRYDWALVQSYYDEGHSINDCIRHFGFARKTVTDACRRGDLVTRPQAMPIENLLVVGRPTKRRQLRLRLLSSGLKENRCERCGIDTWRGAPLGVQLHHRNGDGLDNRLENLELLCPNCHSQTENWGGRNRRLKRARLAEATGP